MSWAVLNQACHHYNLALVLTGKFLYINKGLEFEAFSFGKQIN